MNNGKWSLTYYLTYPDSCFSECHTVNNLRDLEDCQKRLDLMKQEAIKNKIQRKISEAVATDPDGVRHTL